MEEDIKTTKLFDVYEGGDYLLSPFYDRSVNRDLYYISTGPRKQNIIEAYVEEEKEKPPFEYKPKEPEKPTDPEPDIDDETWEFTFVSNPAKSVLLSSQWHSEYDYIPEFDKIINENMFGEETCIEIYVSSSNNLTWTDPGELIQYCTEGETTEGLGSQYGMWWYIPENNTITFSKSPANWKRLKIKKVK